MVKSHNVKLNIKSPPGCDMMYVGYWFDSGRVADGFNWPRVISDSNPGVILCYENGNSPGGCSGYVTYKMGGTNITIAFSNPSFGTNKLGVGINGKGVWNDMGNHNYAPFWVDITLADKKVITFDCNCTGGTTNVCTVTAKVKS